MKTRVNLILVIIIISSSLFSVSQFGCQFLFTNTSARDAAFGLESGTAGLRYLSPSSIDNNPAKLGAFTGIGYEFSAYDYALGKFAASTIAFGWDGIGIRFPFINSESKFGTTMMHGKHTQLDENGNVNENASKIMIPKGNNPEHLGLKIINKALNGNIQFHVGGHYNAVLRGDEFIVGFPNREVDLKVNGKIWSHEVEVQLTEWWDEVFDESYKLMPLNQLESYIKTNKHLPDIPTEKDVLENGIELGEMNALLLKKIEELTLYIIELKKDNEKIKAKIKNISIKNK